jgi:hypothetical protein
MLPKVLETIKTQIEEMPDQSTQVRALVKILRQIEYSPEDHGLHNLSPYPTDPQIGRTKCPHCGKDI